MNEEKKQQIRLGSGKKINDTFLSSSLCITDALEHSYEYNGKKYIKLNISIFAEPDQYELNAPHHLLPHLRYLLPQTLWIAQQCQLKDR